MDLPRYVIANKQPENVFYLIKLTDDGDATTWDGTVDATVISPARAREIRDALNALLVA